VSSVECARGRRIGHLCDGVHDPPPGPRVVADGPQPQRRPRAAKPRPLLGSRSVQLRVFAPHDLRNTSAFDRFGLGKPA
jgi:hypothetical protein